MIAMCVCVCVYVCARARVCVILYTDVHFGQEFPCRWRLFREVVSVRSEYADGDADVARLL